MKIFSTSSNKNDDSASSVVYDFVDDLGRLDHRIQDASLLRHPKEKIYNAFIYYIESLEVLSKYDPEYKKESDYIKQGYSYIANFQYIDDEDKAIVSEINFGQRFEKFRTAKNRVEFEAVCKSDEESFIIWYTITKKYRDRKLNEIEVQKINDYSTKFVD